jgi:hypothetical protein
LFGCAFSVLDPQSGPVLVRALVNRNELGRRERHLKESIVLRIEQGEQPETHSIALVDSRTRGFP